MSNLQTETVIAVYRSIAADLGFVRYVAAAAKLPTTQDLEAIKQARDELDEGLQNSIDQLEQDLTDEAQARASSYGNLQSAIMQVAQQPVKAHSHAIGDVTALQDVLNTKASKDTATASTAGLISAADKKTFDSIIPRVGNVNIPAVGQTVVPLVITFAKPFTDTNYSFTHNLRYSGATKLRLVVTEDPTARTATSVKLLLDNLATVGNTPSSGVTLNYIAIAAPQ